MDDEGGYCAGAEASAGLDQRGGEARMIFIHSKGVELFMAWGLAVFKGSRRGWRGNYLSMTELRRNIYRGGRCADIKSHIIDTIFGAILLHLR